MIKKVISIILLSALMMSGCGGPISMNCTVKVVSNNASVTVEGLLAGDTCQKIINNPKDIFGPSLAVGLQDKSSWFALNEVPKEPQICTYDISGKKFTVRDQGIFKYIGNSLCQSLSDLSKANSASKVTALPATPAHRSP